MVELTMTITEKGGGEQIDVAAGGKSRDVLARTKAPPSRQVQPTQCASRLSPLFKSFHHCETFQIHGIKPQAPFKSPDPFGDDARHTLHRHSTPQLKCDARTSTPAVRCHSGRVRPLGISDRIFAVRCMRHCISMRNIEAALNSRPVSATTRSHRMQQ